ncbi:MAG: N-acetylneuraminate synthase family protein, partial [Proteobacteria bacterium]|nr:N-acetylneuraminate synthase family protein [Pseudomonadota bacterium]
MGVFFIAEAGINHNGDLETAFKLADAARECGADAVKFQAFTAVGLATKSSLSAPHVDEALGVDGTFFDLLRKLELSDDQFRRLADHCRGIGIEFMSSAFDPGRIALLDSLGVKRHKIASMDLNNPVLLHDFAATKKPVILSTGMGGLGEVEAAVDVLEKAASGPITLLHCTSRYPTPPEEANLRAMDVLSRAFGLPVGYSDHTRGLAVPLAAVARGAVVIEKHFTLDPLMPGPDQAASADPATFGRLVTMGREIEAALGSGRKRPTAGEMETRASFRRSIVTTRPVAAGQSLAEAGLSLKRPGSGLPPTLWEFVLQARAKVELPADHLLSLAELTW